MYQKYYQRKGPKGTYVSTWNMSLIWSRRIFHMDIQYTTRLRPSYNIISFIKTKNFSRKCTRSNILNLLKSSS